ncbi:anti-sigma factor family protein [Aureliella helgolandensis]|uniref:Putative zinc-finger domain-containing protein n=1 Tax=Aureliella helgolandensis TaxID=2527968 RepID=A0A518GD68_9BACT|nr:zf-HC2 domain-containing protein [Aureliella helgolandensis]QDV26533.1 hypothetical protein Q31a_49070 [Aureliella helgolandensis]
MKCCDVLDQLSAYYDGELPVEVRDAIAQHLTMCEQCTEEHTGFATLSRAVKATSRPTVPPLIWAQIEAQISNVPTIDSAVSPPKQPAPRRTWGALRPLILAASILLLLGCGYWLWQPFGSSHAEHQHSVEFAATMDHYLRTLNDAPEKAEKFLLKKYQGEMVDPEGAIRLVGYRPAVAQGLPEDYTLASTSVLKMPCCTCVKTVCKRQDGSTLVLFEHNDEKTAWFGRRPMKMERCGDTDCCLVDLDSNIAATWKRGSRSVTIVGVRDKFEVSKLVTWLGDESDSG